MLLLGQNGTGKEVVAQMIHYRSRRRQEPLVAVNCAAITETLLESELFGHEKGAFTDARETRRGKFELASRGTLFLDEIGDMSLAGQAKLLRVLEEKTIVRVGGSLPIATNTRIVAATNQNLAELVRARRFREDLYFRLNVVTLELPPLASAVKTSCYWPSTFSNTLRPKPAAAPPKFTAARTSGCWLILAGQRSRAPQFDGAAGVSRPRNRTRSTRPIWPLLCPPVVRRPAFCRSTCRWPMRRGLSARIYQAAH